MILPGRGAVVPSLRPVSLSSLVRAPTKKLLAMLLDEPGLSAAVQRLEPRAYDHLVRHVGLEDAAELLALATPAQMAAVLDADLWQAIAPGADEAFDPDRFATWLEVLMELGDVAAAERLAAVPEDVLVYGLSEQVWVLDEDELFRQMVFGGEDPSEAALLDKAFESSLHGELDGFLLVSRRPDGWDAVLAALMALADRHALLARRVLERCHRASADAIDDADGLYQVLTEAEELAEDAAASRDERRARAGYVAPAAARAFLRLARGTSAEATLGSHARDALTRGYLRDLERYPGPLTGTEDAGGTVAPATRRLSALLLEAGVVDEVEVTAPTAAEAARTEVEQTEVAPVQLTPTGRLRAALAELGAHDPSAWEARTRELAYLANVLLAGATQHGDALRPGTAAEAALAICALAFEGLPRGTNGGDDDALREHPADQLFRAGWRLLAEGRRLPDDDPLAARLHGLSGGR